jgi:putative endonuclease
VLYIGVTNNLKKRVFEHQSGKLVGFSKKYNCHFLIFYEHFTNINHAINREKELKKWRREKKDHLISEFNPGWKFLNEEI